MPYKHKLPVVVFLAVTLVLAGCGTLATPAAETNPTREPVTLVPAVVEALNSAAEAPAMQSAKPTDAPTDVPPTAAPPTAAPTEVSPTATPTATSTPAPPTATPAAVGDAVRGEDLFLNGKDAAPACVTCHLIDEETVLIGPSMIGIAGRAATRVEGQSAEEYLHAAIIEPNAYLVPNTEINVYAAGGTSLMFQQYADYLTDDEVNDLVAYMLTLE